MTAEFLCRLDELPRDGSLRLDYEADDHAHGLCVVRRRGQTYAYLNRCPHQHTAMDWMPGEFLDRMGEHIICAMHGARFRVEDGYCLLGPCKGHFLTRALVEERDGDLLLTGFETL